MSKAIPTETDDLLEQLQNALEYMSQFNYYQEKFNKADLEPGDIDSIETFRQLPTMDATDLARDFEENPPYGSLIPDDRSIERVNFTPNPHMENRMPVITTNDKGGEGAGKYYRSLGIGEDDVVLNTASMTPFPFGWSIASAAEAVGATHIPMGPGDTSEQARVIQDFNVTVISGFPSFILQIAQAADEVLNSVEVIIAGGEPFTAIDGYREQIKEAYGGDVIAVDGYGLSEVGNVARETAEEDGMLMSTDQLFPEVIDPETGELLEEGEKGELVLTHLTDANVPVLRFRTHDVTILEERDGNYYLPQGVFGRSDNMQKIKGVKVYPGELLMYLAGIDNVDEENVQIRISRPGGGTHHLTIRVGGDPSQINHQELAEGIRSTINVSVDELKIEPDLEIPDDEQIIRED
jgi:phenylacetate-CoA ligase